MTACYFCRRAWLLLAERKEKKKTWWSLLLLLLTSRESEWERKRTENEKRPTQATRLFMEEQRRKRNGPQRMSILTGNKMWHSSQVYHRLCSPSLSLSFARALCECVYICIDVHVSDRNQLHYLHMFIRMSQYHLILFWPLRSHQCRMFIDWETHCYPLTQPRFVPIDDTQSMTNYHDCWKGNQISCEC